MKLAFSRLIESRVLAAIYTVTVQCTGSKNTTSKLHFVDLARRTLVTLHCLTGVCVCVCVLSLRFSV